MDVRLLGLSIATLILSACSEISNHPTGQAGAISGQKNTKAASSELGHDYKPAFENFISRKGNRLFDGDEPFRFISINVPTLLYVEDDMTFTRTNPIRLPTEFETRDVLAAVKEIGGQVVRSYSIPVRNSSFPNDTVTYVEAPGVFNEEAFKVMDKAVAIAAEYDLRLIIPLVNNWPWHGGRPNYAEFRGKDTDAFCSDPQLISDFKQTISFVLNRVNTITGVAYKDDPTIMAWETGNEMTCPAEWAVEITSYLKELAPKQLTIDGWHAVHMPYEGKFISDYIQPHSIDHPSIDMVSTHHYEEDPIKMLETLKETVRRVDGEKPIFVGEFGFISTSGMEQVMDYIVNEEDIAGGMTWSLRRHHENGGWFYHTEPLGGGLYRAYHWPGFDEGEAYDERDLLRAVQKSAYQIAGKTVPIAKVPDAPVMLQTETVGALRWQGAMGASGYNIERSKSQSGPWQVIADNIDDMKAPGFPLFSDETAKVGHSYFYRVIALNRAGASKPSNAVGPIAVDHVTLVDEARNMGSMTRWQNVTVETGDFRSYKEATYRLKAGPNSEVIYGGKGLAKELRIYAIEDNKAAAIKVEYSDDGEIWKNIKATTEAFPWSEYGALYPTPRRYTISVPGVETAQFFRLSFAAETSILRVELDYKPLAR